MVAAKSRLKKVPNVRQKLHNYKGTPSQRVRELKIKTVGAVRKAARKGLSAAKSLASSVAQKLKMPPAIKISKNKIQEATNIRKMSKMQTMNDAVENVRQLQARVLPKKVPPPITSPSPASMKLKGPSRKPPPPPNQTPMRPTVQGAKIAPRVPPKPMALKGRKL